MKKDIPILHSLRAIAALSVCLYHFVCTVTGFIESQTVLSIFSYGKYGVQLFFIISGLVIPWSMYYSDYTINKYPKFALKRFIRLEPPYVVMIFVSIAYTYVRTLSPYYNNVDITPTAKQIALHFGYLIPFFENEKWLNQVFWTLAVEFQYYLSIGILFIFLVHSNKFYRWCSYAFLLSVSFIGSAEFFPYWIPVFMFGILIFLHSIGRISVPEFSIVAFLSSLVILERIDITTLVVCYLNTMLILLAFNYRNKILDWLGNLSYSIYLVHTIIGAAFINFFSHIVAHPLSKILVIAAGMLITIISAWLLYHFVEKPSKKLSSSIRLQKAGK